MAKERLSKLQKWILAKTYEEGFIHIGIIKRYFNQHKTLNARRAIICRSLKNMLSKSLIQKYKDSYDLQGYQIFLTKRGFNVFLKANEWRQKYPNVSFKEYKKRLRKRFIRHIIIVTPGQLSPKEVATKFKNVINNIETGVQI